MARAKIVLSCGGTGGHIYPAIAIAQALLGHDVTFLGSSDRLDQDTVTRYGFQFVPIGPSRGNPLALIPGFIKALHYFVRFRPSVVVCTGGKITFLTGLAAAFLRVPLVVMEQNQIAGRTNRMLAKLATLVVTAFPKTIGLPVGHPLGNPVRRTFLTDPWLNEALADLPGSDAVLLVFGGSQGASALNHVVSEFWNTHPSGWSMIHILGPALYHREGLSGAFDVVRGPNGSVCIRAPYAEEMDALYTRADVVVCRAGATSIAELLHFRVPAVMVPYPHAMDDHQRANATWMGVHSGASVLTESELSVATLKQAILDQYNRPIPSASGPDACDAIVTQIQSILDRRFP